MVQSLKREINKDVQILKLNVKDPFAKQLIRDYRAYLTPTFVIVGRNGEVLWRQSGGILKKSEALGVLEPHR